jgi:hypothetical protein
VLDKMNLQHDATSAPLDNVFKFTGNTNVSITGATLPLFSNVEVALNGSSKIILQRTINITQDLRFQSGLLESEQFQYYSFTIITYYRGNRKCKSYRDQWAAMYKSLFH